MTEPNSADDPNLNYLLELYPGPSSPPEPPRPQRTTGVAISGGGTRSMSAGVGQLRGLKHLGLLDRVSHLSGVSGGSWISTLFTYSPKSISDDEALGPFVAPENLRWWGDGPESLRHTGSNSLVALIHTLSLERLVENVIRLSRERNLSPERVWSEAVGEMVLQPWGLFEPDPGPTDPIYYSLNEAFVRETITHRNPGLTPERFQLYGHDSHPYLCVGSTIFPDVKRDPENLIQTEFTPFGAGVPGAFPDAGLDGRDIGGGAIQPFGMESTRHESAGADLQKIDTPHSPFDLADVIAASGAAFAEVVARDIPELDDILPAFELWPVLNVNDPKNTACEYVFGDGGLLENTSITPLLRRRLSNVISFVNTPDPLAVDEITGDLIIDASLPPLFGYQPHVKGKSYTPYFKNGSALPLLDPSFVTFRRNQVFAAGAFAELLAGFDTARKAGGTIMLRQELKVLENAFFAVEAYEARVLWVYNNPVPAYERLLPLSVRVLMRLAYFQFDDFPNYNTFFKFHLNPRQINLLANLSCWNVCSDSTAGHPGRTNAEIVKSMFP